MYGQPTYVLIRDLPSDVRKSLSRCLDRHAEKNWKSLAENLNFTDMDIQRMERDMIGPELISATIVLLNRWQNQSPPPKVNELFIVLGRMEKTEAQVLLIPYGK